MQVNWMFLLLLFLAVLTATEQYIGIDTMHQCLAVLTANKQVIGSDAMDAIPFNLKQCCCHVLHGGLP